MKVILKKFLTTGAVTLALLSSTVTAYGANAAVFSCPYGNAVCIQNSQCIDHGYCAGQGDCSTHDHYRNCQSSDHNHGGNGHHNGSNRGRHGGHHN